MRYFSIILILILMCLYSTTFCQSRTLFSYANSISGTVVILDNDDMSQVIKINLEDYEDLISKLDVFVVSKNVLDDRIIIEGYTNKLKNFNVINNNKINIQISLFDNVCLVGYPLIKNSF